MQISCVDITDNNKPKPLLQKVGLWLKKNQSKIRKFQWLIILFYFVLLIIPVLHPLPPEHAKIHDNWVRFAQFIFWGIWWPGVILSMIIFGRMWCGFLCPEGTLTEFASKHGRKQKHAIPKWIKWPGWPFLAFALTTIYGQLVSVYDYALPTLLILGGSTVMAIIVGYLWGKNRRVWCRYLCPVTGVFAILSRLAPMHYQTNQQQWSAHGKSSQEPVICAPLISIKQLDSNSHCHMCGRCAGYRNAITFKTRSPNAEILSHKKQLSRWEQKLLVFGIFGIAMAAFQWTINPMFIHLKMWLAEWVVDHEWWWLLQDSQAWWLLTSYPSENDVFNYLDGISILLFIFFFTLCMGSFIWLMTQAAGKILDNKSKTTTANDIGWSLTETLTPLAALSLFLGLSMICVSLLKANGNQVVWLDEIRITLLATTSIWTFYLTWKKISQLTQNLFKKIVSCSLLLSIMLIIIAQWCLVFFIW